MTATPLTAGRKSREVTVSYLGELLQGAGFVDEKQKIEIDNVDRQLRAQSRSARARGEEEASPFKALMAMNLTDASGSGPRIDDFLLARLRSEERRVGKEWRYGWWRDQ